MPASRDGRRGQTRLITAGFGARMSRLSLPAELLKWRSDGCDDLAAPTPSPKQ
jgi:hypothetical protein